MIQFRCKVSGNCVSFTDENDIAVMRKEEGYEEVKEVQNAVQIEEKQEAAEEEVVSVKKRGRPAKVQ